MTRDIKSHSCSSFQPLHLSTMTNVLIQNVPVRNEISYEKLKSFSKYLNYFYIAR